MKRILIGTICAFLIIYVTINTGKYSDFIANQISQNQKTEKLKNNEYAKKDNFLFAKLDDDLIPYSYGDLINVLYTIINSGQTAATFYCPSEYKTCIKDMESLSNDQTILTHINNYVHPFNSFQNIGTTIYESGEINVNINHLYSKEKIDVINSEIDKIMAKNYSDSNTLYENLKNIHDDIINNTKYDQDRNNKGESKYESNTAYGLVTSHFATCNGYTDVLAIILSRLNIQNYKVATTPDRIDYDSAGHVWNALLYDGKYHHIDLTWDDPVSDTGKDYLYHKYFLVTSEAMHEADDGEVVVKEHNFDDTIYLEFNESINKVISS